MKPSKLKRASCVLLALCAALCLAACDAGGGGDGETAGGDSEPEVREDGSADERVYDAFTYSIERYLESGAGYSELGLSYQSGYCYSSALSAAASLQRAVCELLGDASAAAYPDWEAASRISRAVPYPDFFQGLLFEFAGDEAGASECYRRAALYYEFPEALYAFRYLKDASAAELEAIKADCEKTIADIAAKYTSVPYALPLGELDFMAGYHQAAGDCFAEEGNYSEALSFYDTALSVNPFETGNYVACATMALYAGDASAAEYLSEGLTFDPSDAGLNLLAAILFESRGETETAQYYLEIARSDAAVTAEQLSGADGLEARMGGGGQ